jgi:DNA-binding transcriptional MerR regulator
MSSEIVSITEVAKETGVSSRVIRHYASIGLIDADERLQYRTRLFKVNTIQVVLDIKCLLAIGLTLYEIGILLEKKLVNTPEFKLSAIKQSKQQILEKIKLTETVARNMLQKYNN